QPSSSRTSITNRTAATRPSSSCIVPASMKSGTTMDKSSARGALRDMTQTPSHRMGQVVPNEIDALADEQSARFHAAQEIKLLLTGLEQPRARPQQRVVDVAGMHHQLRHAA